MANDMSARQRKHVYMHSTIFDEGGPTTKSVYAPQRQNELYGQFEGNLARHNRGAPEMNLPSASDIKCTQNAGHGAVLPGGHYHVRNPDAADRRDAPKSSNENHLVYDGEAREVLHAGARDQETIPREYWSTSVNLQWHDPRNERCRGKNHAADRQDLSAKEFKMNEMSSAILGNTGDTRPIHTSTNAPRHELMADNADFLRMDTSLHKTIHGPQSQGRGGYPDRPVDRKHQNLETSAAHLPNQTGAYPAGPIASPHNEDPTSVPRRRTEKNYSDMFGTSMGERQEVRGNREEVTATRTCSYLDTRAEIASRNKDHWKHDGHDHPVHRKEAEFDSKLFEYDAPEKPTMDPRMQDIHANERSCWDAKGTMQSSVEISRRGRIRDHQRDFDDDRSHYDRKLEDMGSAQFAESMTGVRAPKQDSPRRMDRSVGLAGIDGVLNPSYFRPDSPRGIGVKAGGPGAADREAMAKSAKNTKLASLQSSIFS